MIPFNEKKLFSGTVPPRQLIKYFCLFFDFKKKHSNTQKTIPAPSDAQHYISRSICSTRKRRQRRRGPSVRRQRALWVGPEEERTHSALFITLWWLLDGQLHERWRQWPNDQTRCGIILYINVLHSTLTLTNITNFIKRHLSVVVDAKCY